MSTVDEQIAVYGALLAEGHGSASYLMGQLKKSHPEIAWTRERVSKALQKVKDRGLAKYEKSSWWPA